MFSTDVVETHHDLKKVKHLIATYPGHTTKPPHHDDDHHKPNKHVVFSPEVVEPHPHDSLKHVQHTIATYPIGHSNTEKKTEVKKVVEKK